MYARVQVLDELPLPSSVPITATELLAVVAQHPGFREGWLVRELSGPGGSFITLWDTREDADLAPERTAAGRGPRPVTLARDEVYQVRLADDAISSDQDPAFAALVWFDGPRSEEQSIADERSGRHRVWPAIRSVPGMVRVIAMSGADRSVVVLALATEAGVLDAMQRTVTSTQLLPDEDPALLTGPDRVEFCAVTGGARATATAR